MAYANHQFDLNYGRIGGGTKRDHLLLVEAQTGQTPKDLEGPDCPDSIWYIWQWWHDLRHGIGEAGIGHQDLLAWSQLRHFRPSAFQIKAILAIDRAFLAVVKAEQDRQRG